MAAETEHDAHDPQHAETGEHAAHAPDPLDPAHVFSHVEDSPYFHVPEFMAPAGSPGHIAIPQPFAGTSIDFKFTTTERCTCANCAASSCGANSLSGIRSTASRGRRASSRHATSVYF